LVHAPTNLQFVGFQVLGDIVGTLRGEEPADSLVGPMTDGQLDEKVVRGRRLPLAVERMIVYESGESCRRGVYIAKIEQIPIEGCPTFRQMEDGRVA
jgi:hypothetical protein